MLKPCKAVKRHFFAKIHKNCNYVYDVNVIIIIYFFKLFEKKRHQISDESELLNPF